MKNMNILYVPPIAIDNSHQIEDINKKLSNIYNEIIYISAMDARLTNIERLCHIIENRQKEMLEIITILNTRCEKLMERVFDLEHASTK